MEVIYQNLKHKGLWLHSQFRSYLAFLFDFTKFMYQGVNLRFQVLIYLHLYAFDFFLDFVYSSTLDFPEKYG